MRISDQRSSQVFNQVVNQQKPKEEGTPLPQDGVVLSGDPKVDTPVGVQKKWTFMHWGGGDNNLDRFILGDVDEMETRGSDENTHVVAMLDLTRNRGAKTYYLIQDDKPGLNSPVVADHGVVNSADPKFMSKFIIDTVKNYPAEHYMFDIGDHGGGWSGAVSDDSHGGWMSMPQIREALDMAQKETGVKMDIVAFDCCLMATGEVAAELKDHANILVASQESEGGLGWNYNNVLGPDGKPMEVTPELKNQEQAFVNEHGVPMRKSYRNILMSAEVLGSLQDSLQKRIDMTPEQFAKHQVACAEKHQNDLPTMSATDLTKMNEFNKVAGSLADSILATDTPNVALQAIARKTKGFSSGKDIYHFAELISNDPTITDEKLKESARNVMAMIGDVIIANEHAEPRYKDAHGLNIEIPTYGGVSSKYDSLAFNKEVPQWKEAMNKMNKKELPPEMAPGYDRDW